MPLSCTTCQCVRLRTDVVVACPVVDEADGGELVGAQAGRNGTFGSRDQIWSAESLGSARAGRPSHWRSESARAVARGKLYLQVTIPMVNKIRGFCHELEHLRNALGDTGPATGAASAFILARLCPFV